MRETKAEEIPVFNLEGEKQGIVMKYYKIMEIIIVEIVVLTYKILSNI